MEVSALLATRAACKFAWTSIRSSSLSPRAWAAAVASPKLSVTSCRPPAIWSSPRVSEAALATACEVSAMVSFSSPAFSVSSSIYLASSCPWAVCFSLSVRERYARSNVAISSRTSRNCWRNERLLARCASLARAKSPSRPRRMSRSSLRACLAASSSAPAAVLAAPGVADSKAADRDLMSDSI